ncbi:hypothetical protein RhiirA4_431814, partial [Rhizophagus irregularis]
FKKAQEAREACERENGASITHPGSTGVGRSDSVSSKGHVGGNTFYTQDWSTHISRKASSLNTFTRRTKATDFCKDNKYCGKDFKPSKLSSPVEGIASFTAENFKYVKCFKTDLIINSGSGLALKVMIGLKSEA